MTTSETYDDALTLLSETFSTEFSDYSGTMSYLDDIYEDEVNDLIIGGVSYFPEYPAGQPPVGDFFSGGLAFLHDSYAEYVPATVGVSLKHMSEALYATRPTAPGTTFGELVGHLVKGDSDAFFSSLSDASAAAKMISALSIGASAMAAGIKVFESQDPISEGQKQGFALA